MPQSPLKSPTRSPTSSAAAARAETSATRTDSNWDDGEDGNENGDDEDDNEAGEPNSGRESPKFQSVVTLENKTVLTGEEDETTLHSARCKLFVWDGENWRERGTGSIRLNEKEVDQDTRSISCVLAVMRSDGVHRVILNVRIIAGLPHKLRDEKYVELIAYEMPLNAPSRVAPALTKFLLKFANKDVAAQFQAKLSLAVQLTAKLPTKQ
eukprot:jgi/Hompol1/5607/HPOL_002231-RA